MRRSERIKDEFFDYPSRGTKEEHHWARKSLRKRQKIEMRKLLRDINEAQTDNDISED